MTDIPRVPGKGALQESAVGFLTSGISAGLMASLAMVTKMPFIFPSLGATVFLLFYRSDASAASPRNTLVGHFIGVVAGLAALALTGLLHNESAFIEGMTWPRVVATALSLALTTAAMTGFRIAHPPAGATTLIVSLGLLSTPLEVLTLCGAIGLTILVARVTHYAFGTPYPAWRPFDELEKAAMKKANAAAEANANAELSDDEDEAEFDGDSVPN